MDVERRRGIRRPPEERFHRLPVELNEPLFRVVEEEAELIEESFADFLKEAIIRELAIRRAIREQDAMVILKTPHKKYPLVSPQDFKIRGVKERNQRDQE